MDRKNSAGEKVFWNINLVPLWLSHSRVPSSDCGLSVPECKESHEDWRVIQVGEHHRVLMSCSLIHGHDQCNVLITWDGGLIGYVTSDTRATLVCVSTVCDTNCLTQFLSTRPLC